MEVYGVDTTHKSYDDSKMDWQIVRDCIAGEWKVKSRKTQYLPHPNSRDKNSSRYDRYLSRASFYNATGRTKDALLGAIYRKEPNIELPDLFNWAMDDIDGLSLGITQSSRFATSEILETGRCGLLVDFPKTEGSITNSQLGTIHPQITIYSAENIINWTNQVINGRMVTVQIVLREQIEVVKTQFNIELDYQYRVLVLEEGVYKQYIYFDDHIVEEIEPRTQSGAPFNYIPFVFIGSESNSYHIDKSPLIDIARINLAHYRNSADLEELLFLVGQASLVIPGLSQAWIESNDMSTISVGSSSAILLPEGGDAKFIQPASDQILASQLKEKEMQMQMLGARLIQQSSGEAAETVRMRQSGEAAILESIANNVSNGYTKALIYSTDFIGGDPNELTFELSTDFFSDQIDAQTMQALDNLYQSGHLLKREVRENLKLGEIIDPLSDYEEFLREQEQEGI